MGAGGQSRLSSGLRRSKCCPLPFNLGVSRWGHGALNRAEFTTRRYRAPSINSFPSAGIPEGEGMNTLTNSSPDPRSESSSRSAARLRATGEARATALPAPRPADAPGSPPPTPGPPTFLSWPPRALPAPQKPITGARGGESAEPERVCGGRWGGEVKGTGGLR